MTVYLLLCSLLYLLPHIIASSYIDLTNDPILPPEGCTAIAVDRAASSDGTLTTHTNDCKDCDFRLVKVPAQTYAKDAKRPVVASRFSYPRYIGTDRGDGYSAQYVDTSIYPWNETLSEPIGHIDQVEQTYSYIDGNYAIINEHQVGIGESTCAGRLVAKPVYVDGGHALFDVVELSKIALERSKSARQAIRIMGDLAVKYGYYGAEWTGAYAKGEAGEALTVTDKHEAWIFHITPDDTGKSAVWVAQRVPDGHIAVVANAFIIQHIDLDDKDNYMASHNIYHVAERSGLWKKKGDVEFNFSKIYGSRIFFEIYCSRRMWRVFTLAAPSLVDKLNSSASVLDLPFSVKVEKKLSSLDLMRIQQDHYEGTEFDMTKGLAAGPFGNPNRYDRGGELDMSVLMQGTFERAISLFRTSYSFVTNSRHWMPDTVGARVWFGSAQPHSTFYTPFYAAQALLPSTHTTGSLYALDHGTSWWAATAIGNYMERAWCHIQPEVHHQQKRVQHDVYQQAEVVEKYALMLYNQSTIDAVMHLQDYAISTAVTLTTEWWGLFDFIITKYHDGYILKDMHSETVSPYAHFYPKNWLKAVNFWPHGIAKKQKDWSYTSDWVIGPAVERPHHNQSATKSTAHDSESHKHPRHHKHDTADDNSDIDVAASSKGQAKGKHTKQGHAHHDDAVIHVPKHKEQRHGHGDHAMVFSIMSTALVALGMGFAAGFWYRRYSEYRHINDGHDEV